MTGVGRTATSLRTGRSRSSPYVCSEHSPKKQAARHPPDARAFFCLIHRLTPGFLGAIWNFRRLDFWFLRRGEPFGKGGRAGRPCRRDAGRADRSRSSDCRSAKAVGGGASFGAPFKRAGQKEAHTTLPSVIERKGRVRGLLRQKY